ncbi:glycoside-pentoside-hexuronide (GPH):cation symporter [Paenibacillus sp. MMS20-IR301]|uniref:MFS transporter n=1 Tax=Paenibacillus sp. MMS20-IR301 TaxID=2895946 RepID=UPI0028EF5693|nr:glycoside-pentoside-hexuronide (GPH):cation symporter [Paenibacillus sp. MMS20-IR301]WNS46040.1 glycoside-pentoside-hexuronide (GPH):cation symporter [Paenibacillus sp. MMS20-IR301]
MANGFEQYYENAAKTPFKRRELTGYLFGGIGDSALSGVVNTFFMVFATAVMNISPITIGTILLVTKFIDAFCDPVVGFLIDNTRTKYGKLRPYILFGGLFWAAMTFLLFFNPGFTSEALKIAYVATVYTLWGIGFSLFDVPYWSMSASITTDAQKRNSLVSMTKSATTLGSILVSLLGGVLVTYFASLPNSGQGYSYLGWMFSAMAAVSFIILFCGVKERVKPSATKTSFKSMLNLLRMNKPLQSYMISQVFQVLTMVITMITSYYAIYNLGSIALLSFIMIPTMIGFLLTPVVVPRLLKRIETPQLFLFNGMAALLVGAVYFVVGYDHLTFVFIISVLSGFCMSVSMTLSTIYVVDSIDYAEWKTGHRAEGIMFAVQSLTAKIMSAFGSFICGLLLTVIGFNNAAGVQSSSTLQGLFFIYAFGVGISSILGAIPLLICKYKGRERQRVLSELAERRAS